MASRRSVLWFGPPGPSRLAIAWAVAVAVVTTAVAWQATVVERIPAWQVRARSFRGTSGADVRTTTDRPDADREPADRVPSTDGIVLALPDWMAQPAVDWRLRVDRAPGPAPGPIVVTFNGQPVLRLEASDASGRATLSADQVRPWGNRLRLEAAHVADVRLVRLANYVVFSRYLPKIGVFTGARVSPAWGTAWPAFLAGLLLMGLVLGGVYGIACRPLDLPLFRWGQVIGLCGGQALAMAAVTAVNWLTAYSVVVTPGSAIGVAAAGWLIAAVVLFFRNLAVLRFEDMSEAERSRWRDRRRAAALVGGMLAVYLSNGHRLGSRDTETPPLVALSLIREGDFDLDEYPDIRSLEEGRWIVQTAQVGARRDHRVSLWSPGSALAAVPFFVLPALTGLEAGSPDQETIAKLAAASLTALSAGFVFLAVRQVASVRGALGVTLGYALGTAAWSTSSQDLWPHAPAQLALAIGLWGVLTAQRRPGRHWTAALALSFAVLCHPPDAFLAAALVLYAGLYHGLGHWTTYFVGSLPAAAVLLGYNYYYFDSLLPIGLTRVTQMDFGGNPLEGGLALVLSPNRGLLVFSPYLAFAAVGIWLGLRHAQTQWRRLTWCIVPALLLHLALYASWKHWPSASLYGCRYAVDGVVLLSLLLGLGIDRVLERRPWAVLFGGLLAVSIFIHAMGVWRSPGPWNALAQERHGDLAQAAWDWQHAQIPYQVQRVFGHPEIPAAETEADP